MARSTSSKAFLAAQLTPEQMRVGIDRLNRRIAEVEAFDPASTSTDALKALQAAIGETLDRTFGSDTVDRRRYDPAAHLQFAGPLRLAGFGEAQPPRPSEVQAQVREKRDRALSLLRQAVKGLEEELSSSPTVSPAAPTPAAPSEPKPAQSRRVFVVHGHDGEAKEAVARFLGQIGFEPVILHEQAGRGRTVIEKVEAHGDVGFAVVLLTPDDEGAAKGQPQQPRARQNVVLELGYFIGRLGRERVCALRRGEVELPSDFGGVVYTAFDPAGAWRTDLGKELQAAGHEVDWNKVFRA